MKLGYLLFVFIGVCLASCTSDYVPKPRGYFRIEFPDKNYSEFRPGTCPFTFEIPAYSVVLPDTDRLSEPCWWYVQYPRFNGTLYLSYKPVDGNLGQYIEDTYELVYKHTIKASEINEKRFATAGGVFGVLYIIGGNAASDAQFFVTDSTRHFIRGALYFNALPNSDSIAPVARFLRDDIEHMIETLRWKQGALHE